MRQLMAIAVLAMSVSPALCDEPQIASFQTFGELKAMCNSTSSEDRTYCGGVVAGTLGTITMLKKGMLCMPAETPSLRQVTDAALKILDAIPGFGKMTASEGLAYGLALAYPCPKDK